MRTDAASGPVGRWLPPALTTAVVTMVVYGILGVVLSSKPPDRLPPTIMRGVALFPTLIAVNNALALASLLVGWKAIREGRIERHRRFMLISAALISLFLILYVTRVALGGVKAFPGPREVRTFVYLPALVVHITLSIISVPLVVHNLLTGLTYRVGDIPRTAHPRVGRLGVRLWSVSLALGIVVYVMLNLVY